MGNALFKYAYAVLGEVTFKSNAYIKRISISINTINHAALVNLIIKYKCSYSEFSPFLHIFSLPSQSAFEMLLHQDSARRSF